MKIRDKWKSLPQKKKVQLIAASVLSIGIMAALPVYAWFAKEKKTATVIQINAPTTISIGAGNKEPVGYIDLSNINVKESIGKDNSGNDIYKTEGEYVFCVTGKYLSEYDLQIARTTNIDFNYELYRVDSATYPDVITSAGITTKPVENSGYAIAEYKSELNGNTYYYPYQKAEATYADKTQGNVTKLGGFLNPEPDGSQTIGDGNAVDNEQKSFHKRNYGIDDENTYNNVNKYAEPLYWQVKNLPVTGNIGDAGFVDYYVLKINWAGKNLENNKETDMIYITARKSVE